MVCLDLEPLTKMVCILSKVQDLHQRFVVTVKSTVEISENFVAFSEYMNFTKIVLRLKAKNLQKIHGPLRIYEL